MAAPGIERLGMTAVAASELATLFADKCSITELLAVEVSTSQLALSNQHLLMPSLNSGLGKAKALSTVGARSAQLQRKVDTGTYSY